MKLLEQVTLVFQEGKSDKVYEVDLLEVRPGACVVNFRYGRRGATLKEGSKTVTAVPFAEGKQVFDRLVQAKIDSGYQRSPVGATALPPTPRAPAPTAAPPPVAAAATGSQAKRHQAILDELTRAQGSAAPAARSWFRGGSPVASRPLERLIWRAGDLRIREAEPQLLALLPKATGLRLYCLAYALGRCGGPTSIEPLSKLFNDRSQPEHLRRMATEALLALSDEATRADFGRDLTEKLPPALRAQVRSGSAIAIKQELAKVLDPAKPETQPILHTLYLIGGDNVRQVLHEVFSELPVRASTIRAFRDLFKSAEFRGDGEFFGLLAYRFEKVPSAAGTGRKRGYHTKTRTYLRRRIWRTLRQRGEAGDAEYVRLALGVLLPIKDSDGGETVATRSWQGGTLAWPAFSSFWAMNHILYGGSKRMLAADHRLGFHLRSGIRVLAPVPEREEAFPRLWEQTPQALLHLCDESRCAPVHEFAAKALRACPDFLSRLDIDALAMLLDRPYEPTAKLGYDLAVQRMDAQREPRSLLLALARSAYAPGRAQAQVWIDEQRARLVTDMDFLGGLASAPFGDTRGYARRLLQSIALTKDQETALATSLLAGLLKAKAGDEEMVGDVARTILATLSNLGSIPLASIRSLLVHAVGAVRELGGELLLKRNYQAEPVPDDLLMSLLDSDQEGLRVLGLRLLAILPEKVLVAHEQLLARLATNKLAEVRTATRAVLQRLARVDHAAGTRVAHLLLDALLRRKLPEGVAPFLGKLLSEDFADALGVLDIDTIWRLLDSADTSAQVIGATLLTLRGASEMRLTVPATVRLANHDLLAVREFAWRHLDTHLDELQKDLASAVRLLDSRWDDSRAVGFKLLRERMPGEAMTLEVLVAICDSTRPDVQAFGREMITRHFREQDGAAMLLKLSEHPSPDVQLFATNYLDRYASEKRELWEQLRPFFTRVLFAVNKSRVAKARILSFLANEGKRDAKSAAEVLELLHVLSATISREDQAAAVETMVQIHLAQPSVPLPVKVVPYEVRHGV